MNVVTKGGSSGTLEKKSLFKRRLIGIKNSWKYEKDLIIIFNTRNALVPIGSVGNFCISRVGKIDFIEIVIIKKV